jgi:hypothetical protein
MTTRTRALMIGVLFTTAFGVLAAMAAAPDDPSAPPQAAPHAARQIPPAVQFIGHDSRIAAERFVLIRDEAEWSRLWAEHTGIDAAAGPPLRNSVPRIDFTRFMVVGVFRGATVNEDGEIVTSVLYGNDVVRVRYEPSTFQTASFGAGPDKGEATRPFGLWVIDRSHSPVVIEEGRRGLKSEPVKWREVKRFEAR